jgi:hypothetical protein
MSGFPVAGGLAGGIGLFRMRRLVGVALKAAVTLQKLNLSAGRAVTQGESPALHSAI